MRASPLVTLSCLSALACSHGEDGARAARCDPTPLGGETTFDFLVADLGCLEAELLCGCYDEVAITHDPLGDVMTYLAYASEQACLDDWPKPALTHCHREAYAMDPEVSESVLLCQMDAVEACQRTVDASGCSALELESCNSSDCGLLPPELRARLFCCDAPATDPAADDPPNLPPPIVGDGLSTCVDAQCMGDWSDTLCIASNCPLAKATPRSAFRFCTEVCPNGCMQ